MGNTADQSKRDRTKMAAKDNKLSLSIFPSVMASILHCFYLQTSLIFFVKGSTLPSVFVRKKRLFYMINIECSEWKAGELVGTRTFSSHA